jgi:hydrogenase maturation protein HypF
MKALQPQEQSIPKGIALPFDGPSVLACGSETKNTFCLTKGGKAFVSSETGDLTDSATYESYLKSIGELSDAMDISPQIVACDLHPDYAPTRYATSLAGVTVEQVQHHHAHIAACMVEQGLNSKVIGIAFDGMGYGSDGTMWGGEFLVCDCHDFQRAAHLKQYAMPGGDSATVYPERMAFSYLLSEQPDAAESLLPGIDEGTRGVLTRMIENRVRSPYTSSVGRLFDAVSAMLGFSGIISHPGEAAIRLQNLAADGVRDAYDFEYDNGIVDLSAMIRRIASEAMGGEGRGRIAAMFHYTLAAASACVCESIRDDDNINVVTLSGGVFMNSLLRTLVTDMLTEKGFEVHSHSLLSCGDSSLSLGQAAVALARWNKSEGSR